jgi:peptide subunit release factor 1 (eRF1)
VFGANDTMAALELGAISKLVLYEELTLRRVVVEHPISHEQKCLYL